MDFNIHDLFYILTHNKSSQKEKFLKLKISKKILKEKLDKTLFLIPKDKLKKI